MQHDLLKISISIINAVKKQATRRKTKIKAKQYLGLSQQESRDYIYWLWQRLLSNCLNPPKIQLIRQPPKCLHCSFVSSICGTGKVKQNAYIKSFIFIARKNYIKKHDGKICRFMQQLCKHLAIICLK